MKQSPIEFTELAQGLSWIMQKLNESIDRPIQEYSPELVDRYYRIAVIVFLAMVRMLLQKLQ